jgi:hypothetical protein
VNRAPVLSTTPWVDAPHEPRAWQAAALPKIIDAVRQGQASIVSAVTGSGKSILIAELIAMALPKIVDREDLVIVLSTPTQALVRQLSATVADRLGADLVGQYYGHRKEPGHKVIVTCQPSVWNLNEELTERGRRPALLICDEVHRTEGYKIRESIETLHPASRIGFTATPFRADEGETLSLWDVISYRYTLADAWRDEVLVPFAPVPWAGGGSSEDVDQICLDMMEDQVGPGVVSALTILDAERYAEWLTDHDFPAEAVHSKRKRRDNEASLAALLAGDIRCVVHVAMLSEGVDIPPLRWICLRRPVSSRVRFVQEVGRVLRICPPDQWGTKTEAAVLDPHDLFGEHGINFPAALGDAPPKPPKGDTIKGPPGSGEREMRAARAVDLVSGWARSLLLVMQADGMAQSSSFDGGAWRRKKPSPKVISALTRMAWASKFLPSPHSGTARWMVTHSHRLRAGAASDLLGVFIATADASHRGWTWPQRVQIPELDTDGI